MNTYQQTLAGNCNRLSEENKQLKEENRMLREGAASRSRIWAEQHRDMTRLYNLLWNIIKAAGGSVSINDLSLVELTDERKNIQHYTDHSSRSEVFVAEDGDDDSPYRKRL